MIDFQRRQLNFPELVNEGGARVATDAFEFGSSVNRAEAAIGGFGIEFSGEHPLKEIAAIAAVTAIEGNLVRVTVTFGWRDDSGDWDDAYNGNLSVLVIVDRA